MSRLREGLTWTRVMLASRGRVSSGGDVQPSRAEREIGAVGCVTSYSTWHQAQSPTWHVTLVPRQDRSWTLSCLSLRGRRFAFVGSPAISAIFNFRSLSSCPLPDAGLTHIDTPPAHARDGREMLLRYSRRTSKRAVCMEARYVRPTFLGFLYRLHMCSSQPLPCVLAGGL